MKTDIEHQVAEKLRELLLLDPYLEVRGGKELLDFLGIFVETYPEEGKSRLRYGLAPKEFIERFLSINALPHQVLMTKLAEIEKNLVMRVFYLSH